MNTCWPAISSRWCRWSSGPTPRRATPPSSRPSPPTSTGCGAGSTRSTPPSWPGRPTWPWPEVGGRVVRPMWSISEPGCARRCPRSTMRWLQGRCQPGTPTPSLVRRTGSTIRNASSWPARSPELVEQAASMSVDAFGRKVRDLARRISRDDGLHHHERLRSQRAVRRWMDREGMCHTQIDLDPETDARLSAVFDAAVAAERSKPDDGRTFDQVRADAFMAMVAATVTRGARRPAELIVLCDLETLRDGLHDHSVCETYDGQPLPPDVIRRLACDADIIPVVLGGDGQVVDVGRARRLATADQRRALRVMHRTCAARTARCASATATSTTSPNGAMAAPPTW